MHNNLAPLTETLPGAKTRSSQLRLVPARLICRVVLIAYCSALLGPSARAQIFEGSPSIPFEAERMYTKGLQFLVQTQTPQGNWPDPQGTQPAVAALAVLSMLAHGEDPNSGPYSRSITRGLDFILKGMDKQTGYIGPSMYNHGFATLALAEAYGAVRDPRLGPALQDAVKLILRSQAQNPAGAWRYSPQSQDADTTVSGAQMVALFAARNAGISVPQEAIQKALQFYLQCQNADGGFGYTAPGMSNLPRSAIGALVLILAKQKEGAACQAAARYLTQGTLTETAYLHYYLYYVSQAHFHLAGDGWEKWNRLNMAMLRNTQAADGSWSGTQGTTFSTACSLLSLALNYRYLPIYER